MPISSEQGLRAPLRADFKMHYGACEAQEGGRRVRGWFSTCMKQQRFHGQVMPVGAALGRVGAVRRAAVWALLLLPPAGV